MPTRNVVLTKRQEKLIETLVGSGRYQNASEVLRDGLRPAMPMPAGGMTTDRVREMLDFYGAEVMLLIGGALLEARENLREATSAFVAEVHRYAYG